MSTLWLTSRTQYPNCTEVHKTSRGHKANSRQQQLRGHRYLQSGTSSTPFSSADRHPDTEEKRCRPFASQSSSQFHPAFTFLFPTCTDPQKHTVSTGTGSDVFTNVRLTYLVRLCPEHTSTTYSQRKWRTQDRRLTEVSNVISTGTK